MASILELRGRLTERFAASAIGQWFFGQSRRDQNVLALLGVFLILVAIYLLVWVPIQDDLSVAQTRHADALGDQRWILSHREEARRAAAQSVGGGGRSGQALLSTVANSARRTGMTLNRFQPEGNDALAVSLDDVPFGELVNWLESLASEEGIAVRQASIDARDESGRVRVRLVLH